MKHILAFLIVGFIVFTNCEGRTTKRQALHNSIETFKKTVTVNLDTFLPKQYTEREVDTTLNNGFRVRIKTYTDMENSVMFSKIKDTINHQTYHRNFKFDILVEKDGNMIFNKSFNKKKINKALGFNENLKEGSELHSFDKLAILKFIDINNDPTLTNIVQIDFMYAIPNTHRKSYHKLLINDEGQAHFVKTK